MRRYGYPQSFAAGVIAAGGTLGAMLPPSTVLAVYGIITEQDIGKLFIAGILPGIPRRLDVHDDGRDHRLGSAEISAGRSAQLVEASDSQGVRDVWATLLLFIFVIGGLYGGLFTPTEAGGVGAGGALIIGVLRGPAWHASEIRRSLLQATRTAAAVFTVLIGALLFGYFLTVTQTPQNVTDLPHRPRHRPLRRAGADHGDVHRARLPDGCAGDGDPDRPDHISGNQRARASIRSGSASSLS